jgi:NAD(P)-dependent dehydrogenase (short-subunit alcohol dehydrogenase family)
MGNVHRGYACNVTDKAACEAAVARVVDEFGRVDVLINNAGVTQPVKTLDIDDAGYDRILDVNLRGTLYTSRAAIPHMQKQKSGSIVCMSSVSAQRGGGIFGGPHYSAAKADVLGLARAMHASSAPTTSAMTWRGPACSSPRTSPPTPPAPSSTSTAAC